MKKVLVISIVMLFACAMVAMAGPTWIAYIAGVGADGTNGLMIGSIAGATDATTDYIADLDMQEPGSASPQGGTFIDVKSQAAFVDIRGLNTGTPQVWTLTLSPGGGYAGALNFYMRFANIGGDDVENLGGAAADFLPTGLTFTFSGGAAGVFTSEQVGGQNRTIQFAGVQAPIVLTVAPPSPIIPEPGSMLALGTGLVGLVGFAIRRRK